MSNAMTLREPYESARELEPAGWIGANPEAAQAMAEAVVAENLADIAAGLLDRIDAGGMAPNLRPREAYLVRQVWNRVRERIEHDNH